MRFLLSLVLLWGIANTGIGQTPAYLHYTVNEGLPGNIVYCGTQDHRGLLWFGTDKGLSCFDGTRFRNYSMKDGLPDPEVLGMFEDSKQRLWLSCFRKEPCYIKDAKIVTKEQDAMLGQLDSKNGLFTFFESDSNTLWLQAWGEDCHIVKNKNSTRVSYKNYYSDFIRLVDNKLLGMNHETIIELDSDGNRIRPLFEFSNRTKLLHSGRHILGVAVSGHRFLLSHHGYIYIFEIINGEVVQLMHLEIEGGVPFTDSKGRFWLCSPKIGAICFDNDQRNLSYPVIYLSNKKVTTMFEDREGTLWFCTIGEGIYALPLNGMKIYTKASGLRSNNITAISKDNFGNVLFGDDEGEIYKALTNNVKKITTLGDSRLNRVRQINLTKGGGHLIGTDKGIFQIDRKGKRINTALKPQAVKCFIESGDTLWIGVSGNISYLKRKTNNLNLAQKRRTTALCKDNSGIIWSGGIDGVYSSHDIFSANWGLQFPLLKSRIVDLEAGHSNTLWVVTPESGLLKAQLDRGRIQKVTPMNDLLAKPITASIQSLFVEPNGTVWLATNAGVYSIDTTLIVQKLDKFDGLADNDVNTILIDGDDLWFGTVSGLTKASRKSQHNNHSFETYITQLRYRTEQSNITFQMLDSVSTTKSVVLPNDAALIEIDFTGLDYLSKGNMAYSYSLSQEMPQLRYATFTNLFSILRQAFSPNKTPTTIQTSTLNLGINMPAGCYTIICTAINAQGLKSNRPDSIQFQLRPYWYQTIWFQTLILGLIILATIRIFRTWLDNRKLHSRVSELRLQALKSQINPHFIGNSINSIQKFFYPPNPQRASQYIATFTRLLRTTMDFSERTFIPFKEEHQYITDYLEMTKLRFGQRFKYKITGTEDIEETMPFPALLLQPILENATIHGLAEMGDSLIEVNFAKVENTIICKITDNGIGIEATKNLKIKANSKRISKGTNLIRNKIDTLNQLFEINASLEITDKSTLYPAGTGTVATIKYSLQNINSIIKTEA